MSPILVYKLCNSFSLRNLYSKFRSTIRYKIKSVLTNEMIVIACGRLLMIPSNRQW